MSEDSWKALAEEAEASRHVIKHGSGPFWPSDTWGKAEPRPRAYMVDRWLATGSAALLAGCGGAGKSLLGQLLCTCVSMGLDFLGCKTTPASATYITCEDDENELHHRQRAINRALGIEMGDLGERLTLWSRKGYIGNELCTFDAERRLVASELLREIRSSTNADLPPRNVKDRLVVLDNAAHMFPGNEIVRHDVAAFCNLLDRLAMDIDGTVVLLAHTPKNDAEYSGSTGWDAHVRQRLYLGFTDSGDEDERVLKRSKANYSRRGETITFRWHNGAFVRPEDMPASLAAEITATAAATGDNALFLACLAERNKQRRAVSERHSPTYAPTIFAGMAESKGIGKARLGAAMDRLFRCGAIERGVVYRDEGKRRDVEGLRLVQSTAPNTPPLTPALNAPEPEGNDGAQHTPPIGGVGAPLKGAPIPSDLAETAFPIDVPKASWLAGTDREPRF